MRERNLGAIAKITSGGTPSRNVPDFWGGAVPWIKTGSLNYKIIEEPDEWITELAVRKTAAKLVPKGTILMAMYGQGKTRGQVAILGIDAAINQACAAITVNSGVSRDFVYFQLVFRYGKIRSLSNIGNQENLNAELIRSIRFPLPSYKEQCKLSEVFVTVDRAIETLGTLIDAKTERKRGLMSDLLTGKRRLPRYQPLKRTLRSWRYGRVPSDWMPCRIGDVAEEVSMRNGSAAGLPVLSCTKRRGLVNSLEYFGKQVYSDDRSNYKIVHRGEFAYATNHIEEGSIGYQGLHERALISPIYTVFRTTDRVEDRFLFALLKSNLYLHIFAVNTSSSVNRRGSLRWSDFSTIPINLPSTAEQSAIADLLDACDRELALHRQQLEALREQKLGLMQKLLTGEVRVKAD